ncbi:MAG: hypothetical protein H8D67_30795 [Deltaproteobacteria bacterium]|nr:hypothetical protein [Deltaproteobacteria bacterium]
MAEVMSFRLNEAHRRKLSRLAMAWKCSQSDVIRRLLEHADDVIHGVTNDENTSDAKSAPISRAEMIEELQRIHREALRKQNKLR